MSLQELIHFYPDEVNTLAALVAAGIGPIDEIEFIITVEQMIEWEKQENDSQNQSN